MPNMDFNKELRKSSNMEEHLEREKYQRQDSSDKNYRNGYSSKILEVVLVMFK
ncbi:hypothetical protein CLAUR_005240 [Clostridium felsineum]|nr:hypothetical protein CLAUR_005240 [Clostridium felsineum]